MLCRWCVGTEAGQHNVILRMWPRRALTGLPASAIEMRSQRITIHNTLLVVESNISTPTVPPSAIFRFYTRATASGCEVEHSGGSEMGEMGGLGSPSEGQSYVHQVEIIWQCLICAF